MPKKYTMILEPGEAASLRVLIKKAFAEETAFIKKAKGDLEWWPAVQLFIDVSERERQILNKAYMALRKGENVLADDLLRDDPAPPADSYGVEVSDIPDIAHAIHCSMKEASGI